MMSALLWLLASLHVVRAGCDAPLSPARLQQHVAQARDAFVLMDRAAFDVAFDATTGAVPCVEETLPPAEVGGVYLVLALGAFLERDETGTIVAFQALGAADPALDLSGWLPAQHPLFIERRYAERFDPDPPQALRVPSDTVLWVDGAPAGELVPERPAVLQLVREEVGVSSYLWLPGEPLPEALSFVEPRLSPRHKRRLWLGSASLAAAGVSAGMLLWSNDIRSVYLDPDTPYARLDVLERNTALTSIAGIVAATASIGAGVTLVVLW